MPKGATSSKNFLAADIASIAVNTEIVHGTGFTSLELEVWDVETVVLQGKVTGGHSNCALDVAFKLVGSVDGVNWDTEAIATLDVTMVGVTAVKFSAQLSVIGYHSLRLISIKNEDTTANCTATLVNLALGKSYPHRF